MNKLVSFVVFFAAFIWTWYLFHAESKLNVNTHAGLQSKLALMIEQSIKNSRPKSFDFHMLSLYTKRLDDNKVTAFFSYRFKEEMEDKERSEQIINGEATLNRSLSENPNDEKWVVQNVKTANSSIEFQEGAIISTGKDEPATNANPQAPEQKPDGVTTTPAPTTPAPEEKKTE